MTVQHPAAEAAASGDPTSPIVILDPATWDPHVGLAMLCVTGALVVALVLWAIMWEVK